MATKPDEVMTGEDDDAPSTIVPHEKVEIDLSPEELKLHEAEQLGAKGETPDEEDARLAEDASDAERDAIRARRRDEKVERKDRRDKAITRDKTELDYLRKQNDTLERRVMGIEARGHQADLQQVDARLNAAMNEVSMAEQVIAKAVNAGNGEDVAKAMRYRDEAMARAQQLNSIKAQASVAPATQQPTGPNEQVLAHAKDFMKDNAWYDPQGRDEDSAVVLAIDQALAKDGYDPKAEDYWMELRKRVARRLPEKVPKAEAGARTPRGGPEIGSGKEHAPTSTRKEVYLSPERKAALVEAGVWDDPILRMKYAKRYAEYDRNKVAESRA